MASEEEGLRVGDSHWELDGDQVKRLFTTIGETGWEGGRDGVSGTREK